MRSILITIGCLLLVAGIANAQTGRGTITGTVMDPAEAVIPGVTIKARNSETGAVFQAESSSTGKYTIGELTAGTYEISATMTGFKQFVRSGVNVLSTQSVRIDIQLEVGEISDTVTVTADAPLLKTESGDLAHNVSGQKLSDLPIVGFVGFMRDPLSAAWLMPGTIARGGFDTFRINGMPGFSQSIRIEGQDATNQVVPGATAQNQASVEAIEEFSIQTSNYAAEYGQAGGGIVNLTMKSGSNDYHGTVYDYISNEALNARRPWLHDRDRDRQQNWGFTFSGPFSIPALYDATDKTFFFFSWEQADNRTTTGNVFHTMPTDAYRNGDFSEALTDRYAPVNDPLGRPIREGTIYDPLTDRVAPDGRRVRDPFPDNKIPPERFDPVSVAIQRLIPKANLSGVTQNYLNPWSSDATAIIPALRIDQNLSDRSKLSFYFSSSERYETNPGINADGIESPITTTNDTNINNHTYRLSFDHSISPTMLLHLGAGHQGMWWPLLPQYDDFDQLKEIGLPGAYAPYFPRIRGLEASSGGFKGGGMGAFVAASGNTVKPTANASLTWIKGNHTYKFGADMRIEGYAAGVYGTAKGDYWFNAAQTALPIPDLDLRGISIGFPYASFLLGLMDNGDIGRPSNIRWGKNAWAIFAQDSWKVTRNLTLDYGLRWDYQTYLREQYGRIPNFSPTTPNPSAGGLPGAVIFEREGVEFAKSYPHAWGPRLGVAYKLRPKTVLRGGIGITYGQTASDRQESQEIRHSNPFSSPSYGDPVILFKDGPPTPPEWPNFDPGQYPLPGTTTSPPYYFDNNAGRPPRIIQWSLGIQQELTENMSIEVSYVGNRGAWWEGNSLVNLNSLTPEGLLERGIDISEAEDRMLLSLPLNSPLVEARGYTAPYADFPMTSTLAQSLRPFPQFEDIRVFWAPLGRTWYDSLQIKFTKRFSHGLDVNSGYTFSKELMMGSEGISFLRWDFASVNDVFNRKANKYLSSSSRPHIFYLAANYTTPRFERFGRAMSWIMRDWTLGVMLQYASGTPITAPRARTTLSSQLFRGTYTNRVPGEPLFMPGVDINDRSTYDPFTDYVLNPNAWEDPPESQFGVGAARYNDYRNKRAPSEAMSIGRIFRLKEGVDLSIRADFNNMFNRTRFSVGGTGNAQAFARKNPVTGETLSGFGDINTRGGDAREGMIVARISF